VVVLNPWGIRRPKTPHGFRTTTDFYGHESRYHGLSQAAKANPAIVGTAIITVRNTASQTAQKRAGGSSGTGAGGGAADRDQPVHAFCTTTSSTATGK